MSSALERIKNKVRNAQSGSVHAQLIDAASGESGQAAEADKNVNVNENVKVDGNTSVNVNVSGDETTSTTMEPVLQQTVSSKRRPKRMKFEELHKRDTFWIRNDLKQKLDELCVGEKGEKTRIVNEALKAYLEKL